MISGSVALSRLQLAMISYGAALGFTLNNIRTQQDEGYTGEEPREVVFDDVNLH